MTTITIDVDEKLYKFVQSLSRKTARSEAEIFREILSREFDEKLRSIYQQYQMGEVSLGYLAKEMGLGRREVEEFLQERGLKVTNI